MYDKVAELKRETSKFNNGGGLRLYVRPASKSGIVAWMKNKVGHGLSHNNFELYEEESGNVIAMRKE
jgi:hypothetical protein